MPTAIRQPPAVQPPALHFEDSRPLNVILELAIGFDCDVQPVSARQQQELLHAAYTPCADSGVAGVILATHDCC